jgi:hypothetical protein
VLDAEDDDLLELESLAFVNGEDTNCIFLGQSLSATLEYEADPTLENEATGSCFLVCRVLGSDAGQGVDSAVA